MAVGLCNAGPSNLITYTMLRITLKALGLTVGLLSKLFLFFETIRVVVLNVKPLKITTKNYIPTYRTQILFART